MNPVAQQKPAGTQVTPSEQRKRIAIFGSTGSIGTQALDVIVANPDKFVATLLTAHSNHELLIEQARRFQPKAVVIVDESKFSAVKQALSGTDILVMGGEKSLEEAAAIDCYDMGQ